MIPFGSTDLVEKWVMKEANFYEMKDPMIRGPLSVLVIGHEGLVQATLYPYIKWVERGPIVRFKGVLAKNYDCRFNDVLSSDSIRVMETVRLLFNERLFSSKHAG